MAYETLPKLKREGGLTFRLVGVRCGYTWWYAVNGEKSRRDGVLRVTWKIEKPERSNRSR